MIRRIAAMLLLAATAPLLSFRSNAEESASAVPAQAAPSATYQLPAAKRITLPNGLVLLLVEKHELPLTSLTLALRTGTLQDPAGKPGINVLTAELLRKGTQTLTAEQLSNQLDFLGLTFNATSNLEDSSVNADFLARDTDKALRLVADIVLHPVFPEDELKKAITRRQERLRTDKDNPQQAIQNYYLAALYAGHPYSRSLLATESSLGAITRADIASNYKRIYTPHNAVLAVVGDFNSAQMEAQLKSLFGQWQGAAPAPVKIDALPPVTGRHVILVDKPDATQTYFTIGNVGISQTSPDRAPVEIVNTLYGGRFTSLFNDELRIKSGYSYGASSRFQQLSTPGPFLMATFTRNSTTGPAIDKTLEVINRLHTHPFTDAQITSAKAYLRGEFPPSLESSVALAHTLAVNEVEGISPAAFNQNLAAEQATTLTQANQVIDKDFPTADNYVLVLVGKASEIAPVAAKYGPVTNKKITDPGY